MKDKNFSSVKEKPFEREKEIQTIVESNTEEIFNLRFVTSEFSLDGLRLLWCGGGGGNRIRVFRRTHLVLAILWYYSSNLTQ